MQKLFVFASSLILVVPAVVLSAPPRTPVPIDMSALLNYDAIGETGEYQYSQWYRTHIPETGEEIEARNSTSYDVMKAGSHAVAQYTNNGRCWISQALADTTGGSDKIGLPMDYKVGDFEIGKGMEVPEGYTRYGKIEWEDPGVYPTGPDTETGPNRVDQTYYLSRSSVTIELIESQVDMYESINLLFSGWRSRGAGTYKTSIEVKYVEHEDFETIWQDARTVAAGELGGTLASMNANAEDGTGGTWEDNDGVDENFFGTDGYPLIQPVVAFMTTRYSVNTGSPGRWSNSTGKRYMWTLDSDLEEEGAQGIPLIPNRTLESIRITNSGSGTNRLHLYGIIATPSPPSGTTVITIR